MRWAVFWKREKFDVALCIFSSYARFERTNARQWQDCSVFIYQALQGKVRVKLSAVVSTYLSCVLLWCCVSYVGEACRIASATATTIAACTPRGQHCRQRFDPWPQAYLFIQHYSKIITQICCCSGHTYSHTNQRPKKPYINANPFNLRPDADDKLILRTNSIIRNNPRSWQAHKKALMNELFTYSSACSAECRPGPPKCHFIMRLQSAALPAPVTSHSKEIGYSSLYSLAVVRQNMSNGQSMQLECLILNAISN